MHCNVFKMSKQERLYYSFNDAIDQLLSYNEKMINGITNLSLKSFLNYSTPEIISFTKKNIFFGYNGKGKSSFAKGIENEILKSGVYFEKNIRFYNSEFIQLKLVNSANNRIKGVKALFGKTNIDSEKEIEKLNSELIERKPIEDRLISIAHSIDNSVKAIEDSIRGKIKLRHSQFSVGLNVDEYITSFKNNYNSALKIVSDDKIDSYKSDTDFESKRNTIQSAPSLDIQLASNELIIEACEILYKTYSSETVPSKELLEWINLGVHLHKEKKANHCLFCGSGAYDIEGIEKQFNKYLLNTKVVDSSKVDNFIKIIKNAIISISDFVEHKAKLELLYENDDLTSVFDSLDNNLSFLKYVQSIFESKIESFESKIEFDKKDDLIHCFNEINNISDFFINLKNKYNRSIDLEEQKINEILKGLIGKRIITNKQILESVKEYTCTIQQLANCDSNNKRINEKISAIKSSISPIGSFATFINGILEGLEINFSLKINDNDYIIVPSGTKKEININDISEGEKNILSLLFFYFCLFDDDKQKQLKDEIKFIVLDDPISSLDDNNHTYIISILRDILNLSSPQIFILTHDWDDFCKISYGFNRDSNYSFFEIKKNNLSQSYIKKTKASISPYEHDFIEILGIYDSNDEDSINDEDIYHLANSARKVLEHFLSFKTSNSSPTNSNFGAIQEVLLPSEEDRKAKNVKQLSTLLNVINVLSHESTRNAHEVFLSIKFLINRIKEVDKAHYSMMKNKMVTLSVTNIQ